MEIEVFLSYSHICGFYVAKNSTLFFQILLIIGYRLIEKGHFLSANQKRNKSKAHRTSKANKKSSRQRQLQIHYDSFPPLLRFMKRNISIRTIFKLSQTPPNTYPAATSLGNWIPK
ncbi:hypothetical protein PAECIP111802_00040 [Paenibacillus allorhizosphaerae]|uniref:Transposase n=1 Tax=Paenibacillus allorhizosphaerae TaxID=2849866 RepID=A0ABN7TCP8_9BACL|nr:hypothetical protein PAECIP111802_00040 [Paenibacillus allorhizosphaerae]